MHPKYKFLLNALDVLIVNATEAVEPEPVQATETEVSSIVPKYIEHEENEHVGLGIVKYYVIITDAYEFKFEEPEY